MDIDVAQISRVTATQVDGLVELTIFHNAVNEMTIIATDTPAGHKMLRELKDKITQAVDGLPW